MYKVSDCVLCKLTKRVYYDIMIVYSDENNIAKFGLVDTIHMGKVGLQ